jgi:Flp pilus assembly protein TadG
MRTDKAGPVRRRRLGLDRGAVAVEFAFVAPLLIALLLGTCTYGLAWSRSVAMSDSVRGGARFGGTLLTTTAGGWGPAVQARVVSLSDAGDPLTTGQVCARLLKGPSLTQVQSSTCSLTAPAVPAGLSGSMLATDCLVVVWAARPSELVAFTSRSANLNRAAYERYERPC